MASKEAVFTERVTAPPFAVREYAAHIEAQTLVETDFSQAGKHAFGRLFKYISGHNRTVTAPLNASKTGQKIPMTSPVTQIPVTQDKCSKKIAMTSPVQQRQVNEQWQISFIMPAGSRLETLPTPKDPSVRLAAVSAQWLAVIRYSGSWSEANFQEQKKRLEHWINDQGYQVIGKASWDRYNPPFTLWFMRRNEIFIPITAPVMDKKVK